MKPTKPFEPSEPLEERVRDELSRLVDAYVPSPGLPERIEARTRQRARDRKWVLVGATAAAVVLAAGLVAVTRGGGGRTTTIASGTSGASSFPSTSAAPGTTVAALRPPVSGATAVSPPKTFLAAVGGGNERAVIIDSTTGHVIRTLTAAPSGQQLWAVSVDGRTLYAPTQQSSTCSRTYVKVDTASGASAGAAFAGLSDLQLVAPAPDGQTVAYTTGCQPSDAGANQVFLRRADLSTTTLATGSRAIQMSWSADGALLAVQADTASAHAAVQIWTIGPGSIGGPHVLAPPDARCRLALPRFGRGGLYVVETCPPPFASGPSTVRLLLLGLGDGTVTRSWPLLTAAYAMVADLAIDPTGGWALYSLNSEKLSGQVSLLSLAPATAKARVLLSGAFELAWLPDSVAGAVPTAVPASIAPTTRGPAAVTTVPTTVVTDTTAAPPSTSTSLWRPSCTSGAPTTPYFPNGCIRPDGSIQPPY